MNRAVVVEQFGGPEVLEIREVPEPHAGPGTVRVRVAAAGLNPMDWRLASSPGGAAAWGLTLPMGFGSDFAGTADEVGDGVSGFAVGDRVFGGAIGRAIADRVVVDPAVAHLTHTPDGVDDAVAATLPVAARTADAVIAAIDPHEGDTVLVGGAAGGVGVVVAQLARLAGARVIGTASEGTFGFLEGLGVEPVARGEGLADRVKALVPDGLTAAADMVGDEAARAALALGVPASRVATIAAPNGPEGVRRTGGREASPDALDRVAALIAAGRITMPISGRFPLEDIREAVELQRTGHVHGKVVVMLDGR